MNSTEDLAARVARLEQIFEEREMDRPSPADGAQRRAHPLWDQIPFSAWLKISGPGFALMALGFGVLWNGQQATTQRILDLEQSTTDRILSVQERILEMERSTTDRILEMQRSTTDRILEMQQQMLDLHREATSP